MITNWILFIYVTGYKLNIRFEAISVVCDIGKQFETILNYIYSSNIKCLDINALNI